MTERRNKPPAKVRGNTTPRKAIKDWPENERPREKLVRSGAEALSDGELLAILLRIGHAGQSAEGLGRQLLDLCGGLGGIDRAHVEELLSVPGLGIAKAAQLNQPRSGSACGL